MSISSNELPSSNISLMTQNTDSEKANLITPLGKRFIICRIADWVGAIPIVGAAVGVARAVLSGLVAALSFTGLFILPGRNLVLFFSDNPDIANKSIKTFFIRLNDEGVRGLCELVTLGTLFFSERQTDPEGVVYTDSRSDWEDRRIISGGRAYGTYMYEDAEGTIKYSRNEFLLYEPLQKSISTPPNDSYSAPSVEMPPSEEVEKTIKPSQHEFPLYASQQTTIIVPPEELYRSRYSGEEIQIFQKVSTLDDSIEIELNKRFEESLINTSKNERHLRHQIDDSRKDQRKCKTVQFNENELVSVREFTSLPPYDENSPE